MEESRVHKEVLKTRIAYIGMQAIVAFIVVKLVNVLSEPELTKRVTKMSFMYIHAFGAISIYRTFSMIREGADKLTVKRERKFVRNSSLLSMLMYLTVMFLSVDTVLNNLEQMTRM